MNTFNRMTLVAAAEVVGDYKSHSDMDILAIQWGLAGRFDSASKSGRIAGLAQIAIEEELEVITEQGILALDRALVEIAFEAPPKTKEKACWTKFITGLRFDGFELLDTGTETEPDFAWQNRNTPQTPTLVRMLPETVPNLEFREAESEIERLLEKLRLPIAKGHLRQALAAFGRGEWSSANGELRNFYENCLTEIADKLGHTGKPEMRDRLDFLGELDPPFLLVGYNEWDKNQQKPQFAYGLWHRFHPHGPHPGLSEEEDATFRLQIVLITARLFLRRLDRRLS